MKKMGLVRYALLLVVACTGCSTGPTFFERHDKYSNHEPGSDAWWAEKATLPPGVRQKNHKGKIWPIRPRSNQEPQQFSHTYYSEHYWPLPYVCQDRESVRNMMDQQVGLGWQEETTLYDRHFDGETQQLNRSGALHLDYILHVVPPERRNVYIQSTYDAAMDSMRTEAVNTAMSSKTNTGGDITVTVRDCQQVGRPASEVEQINTLYRASTPSPRISTTSSSTGGGSAPPAGT